MQFVSSVHRERFFDLVGQDGMSPQDRERASLFYLITGNDDLYGKRNFIYGLQKHCIRLCLDSPEVDFSSGMSALVRLGFNLYNGWADRHTTPLHLFWNLDQGNQKLAPGAIQIRVSRAFPDGGTEE